MATVLISGGTGLIGAALCKELLQKQYKVIILTRQSGKKKKTSANVRYAQWDVQNQTIDPEAVKNSDFIVHLAGANIAGGRWTAERKKVLVASRVNSSRLLVKALTEIPNNVKAVVSASAIGWYGEDPQVPNPNPFVESAPADNTFLGRTCSQWEASIEPVLGLGKRLVKLRTGIVLSNEGGAFAEFKKPHRLGVATILGKGKQVISWIHILDIVRLYVAAIENTSWQGVYNAVAPNPVTNGQLNRQIAKERGSFHVPVHVPEFALKLALGEMSVEVLKSTTVSCKKVQEAGFQFFFPSIEAAVHNLMNK